MNKLELNISDKIHTETLLKRIFSLDDEKQIILYELVYALTLLQDKDNSEN